MKVLKKWISAVPNLFKVLLLLVTALWVSLLAPKGSSFRYEFAPNQAWRYDELEAPFDFAILKPDSIYQQEVKQAKSEIHPVYVLDTSWQTTTQTAWEKALREPGMVLGESKEEVRRAGFLVIQTLADKGLAVLTDTSSTTIVSLIKGGETSLSPKKEFFQMNALDESLEAILQGNGIPGNVTWIEKLKQVIATPQISYSDSITSALTNQVLETISNYSDKVSKGDLIVFKGANVTPDTYQKLLSLQRYYQGKTTETSMWSFLWSGYTLLALIAMTFLLIFFLRFEKSIWHSWREFLFMLCWVIFYAYLVYAIENNANLKPYVIPYCIAPLVIKNFYNRQVAFVVHLVIIFIVSFLSRLGYEFTILQLLVAITLFLSPDDVRKWSVFFNTILFIFLVYGLGFLALGFSQDLRLDSIDWQVLVLLGVSSFLNLLAYPLMPLLERIFGYLSNFTLSELADTNQPLLQQLASQAPGTYQHSIQVANLSEAAARAIGADAALVKVGALYHDIGKTINPRFFIENQGEENPHDYLPPHESAAKIIAHVTDAIALAKKNRLPKVLNSFILTHHGKTRVEYFYQQALQQADDETPVNPELFTYPGPKPYTREQSILMIADSIEAACKSMKQPTEMELYNKIDHIIEGKIASDQLKDSPLSFKELEICREVFKRVMRSVHHNRILYPNNEQPKDSARKLGGL